jgi:hypothetical protein
VDAGLLHYRTGNHTGSTGIMDKGGGRRKKELIRAGEEKMG